MLTGVAIGCNIIQPNGLDQKIILPCIAPEAGGKFFDKISVDDESGFAGNAHSKNFCAGLKAFHFELPVAHFVYGNALKSGNGWRIGGAVAHIGQACQKNQTGNAPRFAGVTEIVGFQYFCLSQSTITDCALKTRFGASRQIARIINFVSSPLKAALSGFRRAAFFFCGSVGCV